MSVNLFAGIPVSDLARSREWYGRFLGDTEPFAPNETELVWDLADGRSVYLATMPDRAGRALVTLFLDDDAELEHWLERISGAGIEVDTDETYENGVRKVTFRDPDGNELGVGGMPVVAA